MRDGGAPTMRMAAAAMLAVFVAVGLVGTLNYLRFETNLTDLVTSRLDVLLDDISAPAQLAVDLDLGLPAATDLHAALQRRAAADPLILGIRIVDSAQYEVRIDDRDFDVITVRLNFFPPPGPELRSYYGSAAAGVRGSANLAGIQDPVADSLIEQIIAADDLETLKATNRALDRVLLWQHYVIPQFHDDKHRLAFWNKFGYPATVARYSHGFPGSWWLDESKAESLTQ